MADFNTYKDAFPHAKLGRSPEGVIEVVLHANGSTLIFNGYTHEEFVDLFHAVGCDSANRVVILTGTGDAVMEEIAPEGFDFFTPAGYDKIYREGKKVLMKILDIEVPMIAALNGPIRLRSEYALLCDIVIATPDTVFQDKPHFQFGIEFMFLVERTDDLIGIQNLIALGELDVPGRDFTFLVHTE